MFLHRAAPCAIICQPVGPCGMTLVVVYSQVHRAAPCANICQPVGPIFIVWFLPIFTAHCYNKIHIFDKSAAADDIY